MNEEKPTTATTLEGSAFARVLARIMETRGIPADQEHALELAERSGIDRETFRKRLAGEDANPGDLTRFAEELALSIPEMQVLALAYTLEEERELEGPTEEKTVRELREEMGLTVEEMAAAMEVSERALMKLEHSGQTYLGFDREWDVPDRSRGTVWRRSFGTSPRRPSGSGSRRSDISGPSRRWRTA